MDRVVHVITSECEAYISTDGDVVRVRITEKNKELLNPTSFEIEGDPLHISEVLTTVAAVLAHIKDSRGQDN